MKMKNKAVLLICLGMLTGMISADQSSFPEFSWDTIPRWIIFRSGLRISDDAVTRVANHYPLTVLEKSNTQGFDYTEQGLADLAPRLKSVNPNIVNLAYWNSYYYWPGYEAGIEFYANEEEWSKDPVGTTGRLRLNHANTDMQEWWVRTAVQELNPIPGIDGIFNDTLRDPAHDMVAEMHAQLPPNALTVGNGTWREDYWLDYFDGSYLEGWWGTADEIADFIARSRAENAQGKIIAFRGQPDHTTGFTGEEQPSDLAGQLDWVERNVDFSLAVFLMIAEEYSYFRYGSGVYARTGENSVNHVWDTSYMDVFTRPFGPPMGPPVQDGYLYTRSFRYLDVSVNVETGETSFNWDAYNGAEENIALNGTASQSSTDHNGVASRAIDGNTSGVYGNGSVSHTTTEQSPWWQVDLGAPYEIEEIQIYGRTDDCCQDRLSNYDVSILNCSGNVVWSDHQDNYPTPAVTLDAAGTVGRYVKVQLVNDGDNEALSLAEVRVFSDTPAGYCGDLTWDGKVNLEDFSELSYNWLELYDMNTLIKIAEDWLK